MKLKCMTKCKPLQELKRKVVPPVTNTTLWLTTSS